MFIDYKYNRITKDSLGTSVVCSVYTGDFEEVTYEDIDLKTGKPKTVKAQVYKRTTSLDKPISKYHFVFNGELPKEKLDEQMTALLHNVKTEKAISFEVADEQKVTVSEKLTPKEKITLK